MEEPQPGTAVPDVTPVEAGDVEPAAQAKAEPEVTPAAETTDSVANDEAVAGGDSTPAPAPDEPMEALETPAEPAVEAPPSTDTKVEPVEAGSEAAAPVKEEEPVIQAMEAEEARPVSSTEEKSAEEPSVTPALVDPAAPAASVTAASKKPKVDVTSLPTRQYLDQTVVPILLQGLSWLAKTRPDDPIPALSNYLLEHKQEFEGTSESGSNNLNGTS